MSWRLYPAGALAEHGAAWQQLHARGPASALLHLDFVGALLAAFGQGGEQLAIYSEGGQVGAMALLARRGPFAWQTFQPAQAPLGIWLQDPALAVDALLEQLLPQLPGLALAAGLTQCDPLFGARPPDSARLRTLDYIQTARIAMDQPFDAYWQQRGKNLRGNLKKQRARLQREGQETRIDMLTEAGQMAQAIADYGRLESSGWKGREGSAVHADNEQGKFYRAMLEAFGRRGAARVYRYWIGAELVAMDLCIEDQEAIVVLKTAYDETVPSGLSPTLLMREEACRQLFDEGRLRRIEFYGKVMEWHTRWCEDLRTLYHINYYRWAPLASLHAARTAGRLPAPPLTE